MKVPSDNVVQMQQPQAQIEPKYLMMAAALMHQEGRLFEPKQGGDEMADPTKIMPILQALQAAQGQQQAPQAAGGAPALQPAAKPTQKAPPKPAAKPVKK